MGQFKHDGRSVKVTFPAGVITKGDLYRIDGWTGVALDDFTAADTMRDGAMEVASERVWYVKIPAALAAARGDLLYWSAGAGFKRGDTDLVAAGTAGAIGPACKVEEAVDANDWCAVRILQTAPS